MLPPLPLLTCRSLCTYTAGVPSVCLLAGAAGMGTLLLQQQLVMSGSNWAPYLCALSGSPFLYRAVASPEDAQQLPQVRRQGSLLQFA
jgi:hypothetical protein